MGIVCKLHQISIPTLNTLRQEPILVKLFWAASCLPESPFWQENTFWDSKYIEDYKQRSQTSFEQFKWADSQEKETLKNQFLSEWEIPELDLHKNWEGLSFLLAGYVRVQAYSSSPSTHTAPELRSPKPNRWNWLFSILKDRETKEFFDFLVLDKSEWDGLPLVNAIGAGTEIGYATGYGPLRYLLPDEVQLISDGLIKISEDGFQKRYMRESEKEDPCPWIDWSEEDMLEWMTDYYKEMVDYYRSAAINQKAMLLYLT
jgi:hypothetical protein